MIFEYEQALVSWVAGMDGNINKIIFSNEFNVLTELSQRVNYPAVLIERNLDKNVLHPKVYKVETDEGEAGISPVLMQYKIKVWKEKLTDSLAYSTMMRFYHKANSYVNVIIENETVPIGMRFIYSGIEEEIQEDDRKGARRAAVLVFESTLVIDKNTVLNFINNVSINLNNDFTINI